MSRWSSVACSLRSTVNHSARASPVIGSVPFTSTTLLDIVEDGKEKKVGKDSPCWMEIRGFDSTGKPLTGLPGNGGCFEITLPRALLEGQPKNLDLGWIDFYRR